MRAPTIETFPEAVSFYLDDCVSRDMSPHTIATKRRSLERFMSWCALQGIGRPQDVDLDVMEDFRFYLQSYRKLRDGEPLSINSKHKFLTDMKLFLRRLHRRKVITNAEFEEFELPKCKKRLPRKLPSHAEVELILQRPLLLDNDLGQMDRAIMEILYACAIRRSELTRLRVEHVDLQNRILFVEDGKGMKDRRIPILPRACDWLQRYITNIRPRLRTIESGQALFLALDGKPCTADQIGQRVGKYIRRSGVEVTGACHVFRHTVATAMLDNGADLRQIQVFLGHADISTTQFYTHVAIKKLTEVCSKTHPALWSG